MPSSLDTIEDECLGAIQALPDAAPSTSAPPSLEFRVEDQPSASTPRDSAANSDPSIADEDQTGTSGDGSQHSPEILSASLPDAPAEHEVFSDLKMVWSGQIFEFRVGSNDLVYDFREKIYQLTMVPPDRQKLIGIIKGKLSAENDAKRFSSLGITKKSVKFTMIGVPVDQSFKDKEAISAGLQEDDFDVMYTDLVKSGRMAPINDPRNQRKLKEVIMKYPITVMNEPRPGKHLLVLDLDYTLVDTRPLIDGSLPAVECIRPGMHEFLTAAYEHYDIVIWSQTSWRWLESKLVEIGIIGEERGYDISFVIDKEPMFSVFATKNGKAIEHQVKPLPYIWARFPQWSAKNTVHIDDLSRNFALNPGEGLKISAYKGAGIGAAFGDRALPRLSSYLGTLAAGDFTRFDHANWKKLATTGERQPPADPQPENNETA